MSREIKFRAWDGENMFLSPSSNEPHHLGSWFEAHSCFGAKKQNSVFQQYTGLKDKNGKEIYEGDIVKMPFYGITIIIWNDDISSFQYSYHAVAGKGVTNTLYKYESEKKYMVIGNIYENANLLTNA